MRNGIATMWNGGHLTVAAIAIWFSANLMFQAAWMGRHGEPFEAGLMLQAMGPFAAVAIVVELVAWVLLLGWLTTKLSTRATGRRATVAGGD